MLASVLRVISIAVNSLTRLVKTQQLLTSVDDDLSTSLRQALEQVHCELNLE